MKRNQDNDDSIQRLLRLMTLLRLLGDGATITELARKLEVSRWTIKRMLDRLPPELGLYEDESLYDKREKRWFIDKDRIWTMTLPGMILSDEERNLFSAILSLSGDIPVLGESATSLERKVMWMEDGHQRRVFSVPPRGKKTKPESSRIVKTILEAIEKRKWLKFEYFSAALGEYAERTVYPMFLFIYEGSIYLRAITTVKEHHVTYDVERIIGEPIILEAEREIDTSGDDNTVLQDPFGPFGNGEEYFDAVILLDETQGWFASEINWPRDMVSIEKKDDGHYLMRVRTCYKYGLRCWILQQGKGAVVLEPKWLRDSIREEFGELAIQYK